mmetsp:Transcript_37644/g.88034  ORF Transcript_37644/g.88034 Transcript_37644/m.88034 type:complete len:296 (-) Transcript_37644:1707-2594(-)
MVEHRNGVQRAAVVVELALVAPLRLAVDHKVPVASSRTAVRPVGHHRRVAQHRLRRLVGRFKVLLHKQPGVYLLVTRRVPRKLRAVRELHLQPLCLPPLDHVRHLERHRVQALAPKIDEHQCEDRTHHQTPLRSAGALATEAPHGERGPRSLRQVPPPVRAARQWGVKVARKPVERPVHRHYVWVVVRAPRFEGPLLRPAVHPVALGPALGAHLSNNLRHGLRRGWRRLQLVVPVQERRSDGVVTALHEAAALTRVSRPQSRVDILLERSHLLGRGRAELLDRHREGRSRARFVG